MKLYKLVLTEHNIRTSRQVPHQELYSEAYHLF